MLSSELCQSQQWTGSAKNGSEREEDLGNELLCHKAANLNSVFDRGFLQMLKKPKQAGTALLSCFVCLYTHQRTHVNVRKHSETEFCIICVL